MTLEDMFDSTGHAKFDCNIPVHTYSPDTGEYIGSHLEDIPQGVSIPGNSTMKQPLAKMDGFAIVFSVNDNKWNYVEDHRNEILYYKSDCKLPPVQFTELGPIPDVLTSLAPKSQYDAWDGNEWVTDGAAVQKEEVYAAAIRKDNYLGKAQVEIDRIKFMINNEIADESDTKRLVELKKFYSEVFRIDVKKAPNITWPELSGVTDD